ncbi:hypothetical protein A2U01_0116356, partial [Trifolium medium]|nr:hypothetical protein [Trifolium medium]
CGRHRHDDHAADPNLLPWDPRYLPSCGLFWKR